MERLNINRFEIVRKRFSLIMAIMTQLLPNIASSENEPIEIPDRIFKKCGENRSFMIRFFSGFIYFSKNKIIAHFETYI